MGKGPEQRCVPYRESTVSPPQDLVAASEQVCRCAEVRRSLTLGSSVPRFNSKLRKQTSISWKSGDQENTSRDLTLTTPHATTHPIQGTPKWPAVSKMVFPHATSEIRLQEQNQRVGVAADTAPADTPTCPWPSKCCPAEK